MGLLSPFRVFCYIVLWIFSAATLGMTAARLHHTLHGGAAFYDIIIAEILATAALTMLFVPILIVRILRRRDHGFLSTFGSELIGLLLLFTLWIVGAAIATRKWGNLGWCHNNSACRLLTAIVAFTWMSWIMTLLLTIACISYIARHNGFSHPVHGRHHQDTNMRQV